MQIWELEADLAKAERHCDEAINDVVRVERFLEKELIREKEVGTYKGRKLIENLLSEIRLTDK